jgi:hypothetical protein
LLTAPLPSSALNSSLIYNANKGLQNYTHTKKKLTFEISLHKYGA